ncbi:uncharacterized protein LOC119113351 [Pollicipes pollicipes]|uniref:uncharacterized protein LOC119113351 n=1 Tax=Pollicipes pollicipes TaxID=41117 RepID=UPI001885862E|nr:uncharacterized protein LOC119113351 [Pollicipes pollicipes]
MSGASKAAPPPSFSHLPPPAGQRGPRASGDLTSEWLAAILRACHGAGYCLRGHEGYALPAGSIAVCSQLRGFTARGHVRGQEVIDHVVVKLLPEDPQMRRLVVNHRMFQCETMVYRDLLPKLCRFEAAHGSRHVRELTVPCLYAGLLQAPDYAIVLENVQKRGFRTIKSLQLRKPQLNAAVRSLAQLAATSHVWLQETCTEDLPYLQDNTITDGPQLADFIRMGLERLSAPLELGSHLRLRRRLLQLQLSSVRLLDAFLQRPPAFRVLCHGDFRDGNLLLRETPDGDWQVRAVDWQTSRLGSPALDLLYLLLFSLPRREMADLEEDVLAAYGRHFNRKLAELGCARRYSADQLRADFTAAKLVGLVWCLSAVQFWERVPGWAEHTLDLALEVDRLGLLDGLQ